MATIYHRLRSVLHQAYLIQGTCLVQDRERPHRIQLPIRTVRTATLPTWTATKVYQQAPNISELSTSIFHLRYLCAGVPYISCKDSLLLTLRCRRFLLVDCENGNGYIYFTFSHIFFRLRRKALR